MGDRRSGGQASLGFAVFFRSLFDNLTRQRGRWRAFIPAQSFQVVTHILFVKTHWTSTRCVGIGRPESRRVGGQYFIDQHKIAFFVGTKLELGIGNDDASFQRVGRCLRVEVHTHIADLLGHVLTEKCNGRLEIDVLIMLTNLGFCGWCVKRIGKLIGLA